jgi:hypothetical protein
MLYGLDALAHGAVVALLVLPAALWALWRLAAGAPRTTRILLCLLAAYGAVSLAGSAWALLFERAAYEDEALFGALLAGLALMFLACPILLLVSRKS